ncbi:hypothetical protein Taro_046397, partial [Colocasia esculenta]|nr:hypothetical protein [Colocasia esculenta]
MFTASVLVYGFLVLGEFPTEPVTSEAHPYSPQVKVKRKFCYRLPVQGRVIAVLGQRLQQCSFRSSVVSFLSCTSLPWGMPQAPVLSCTFVEIWLCKSCTIYMKCGFLSVFTDSCV